jgi:serine/threonine protein kinase
MKTLGKFEILDKIGQGAMGVVYKARDPFIGRLVALKTITTGLAEDPTLLERFYQEARSAGALQHPNIVTIFELGKEGDTPFIAMQYLAGESLDKLIERQPALPLSQRLGYIVHVCRALEYAHKRGVVHRDIKPGNVMVTTEGTVTVVDFGIARLAESSKTQSGLIIGTLGYMSPQQLRGHHADARSDIWAVGVLFYELLAYQRPFNGDNQAALMMNILTLDMPSLSEMAPGAPPDVALVVSRMLQKEVGARFQSMEEVLIELEPIWRRLQQAEVSGLVADSQELLEARDFTKAQDVLRRALQIDTANTLAKNLLEKVNAEVRRSQILPQVKSRVESAQNLLAAKKFDDAKAEAESALQLDPTFQPALELLAQVQAAAEHARALAQALRTTKQRVAEGALTEAELQIAKVLEIDADNATAYDLLVQIREEKARRERQKRLSEILHRARSLWSNLDYDECIHLLVEAQKEFPSEAEIVKLLETARQDQAEQRRQLLLAEARRLLSSQRFEEALKTLDHVLKLYPADSSAKNLRTLAVQGREQKIRELRLKEHMAVLRVQIKEGKYQEASAHGEQLLGEFPGEFELAELVEYARSEHAHAEQKRQLEQWLGQIKQNLEEERFRDAIRASETALGKFPRNVDLLILLERAKERKKEKETRELLEQRVKEIDSRIERQELTEAIDLARQTLVTVGVDTEISRRLRYAEMEYEQREKKKRDQEKAALEARTLVDVGKLDDASLILRHAVETQLFSPSDPRVDALFREIDSKKATPSLVAPTPVSGPSASVPASPSWPKPTGDPAKDYVYEQDAALQDLLPSQQDAKGFSSATMVAGGAVSPLPPVMPEPSAPTKREHENQWEHSVAPDYPDATMIAQRVPQIRETPSFPTVSPQPQPSESALELTPEPMPKASWKWPLAIAAIGTALAVVIGLTIHLRTPIGAQPTSQSETSGGGAEGPLTASGAMSNGGVRVGSGLTNSGAGSPATSKDATIGGGAHPGSGGSTIAGGVKVGGGLANPAADSGATSRGATVGGGPPDSRASTSGGGASTGHGLPIPSPGGGATSGASVGSGTPTGSGGSTSGGAAGTGASLPIPSPGGGATSGASVGSGAPLGLGGSTSGGVVGTGGVVSPSGSSSIVGTPSAPATLPSPVTPAVATDQDKIRRLLDDYIHAYESKDREELRTVWPNMSDKQFKDYFNGIDSIQLALRNCVFPVIDASTVTVTCVQDAVIKAKGGTQRMQNDAMFALRKLGSTDAKWIIERAEYKKAAR